MFCLQEPVKKDKRTAKRKVATESDSDDDFVVVIDGDSDDDKAEDADFIDDDDGKAPKASKKQKTASGKAAPVKAVPTPYATSAAAKGAAPVPAAAPTPPRHAPHIDCGLQLHLGHTGIWGSADLHLCGYSALRSSSAPAWIHLLTAPMGDVLHVFLRFRGCNFEISSAGHKARVQPPTRRRAQNLRLMCKQPLTPLTERSSCCRTRPMSTSRCMSSRREGAGTSEETTRPHKILGPRLPPASKCCPAQGSCLLQGAQCLSLAC